MQSVKRSFGAVSEGEIFERICGGPQELGNGVGCWARGNPLLPPLGVIEVIHVVPKGFQVSKRRGLLAVISVESSTGEQPSKKKLKCTREPIAFNDDDLEGTIQPYDDALVVVA